MAAITIDSVDSLSLTEGRKVAAVIKATDVLLSTTD